MIGLKNFLLFIFFTAGLAVFCQSLYSSIEQTQVTQPKSNMSTEQT